MIETVSYPGMVTSKGGKRHAVIGIDALRELFLRRWIFLALTRWCILKFQSIPQWMKHDNQRPELRLKHWMSKSRVV
jgi:hypothetical protein